MFDYCVFVYYCYFFRRLPAIPMPVTASDKQLVPILVRGIICVHNFFHLFLFYYPLIDWLLPWNFFLLLFFYFIGNSEVLSCIRDDIERGTHCFWMPFVCLGKECSKIIIRGNMTFIYVFSILCDCYCLTFIIVW